MSMKPIIACPDCGTVLQLPPLRPSSVAVCPTCDHYLERTRGRSQLAALCFTLATCVLLLPADFAPLMRVSMAGVTRSSNVPSGIVLLWNQQWVIVAALAFAFIVVIPLIHFALLALVLALLAGAAAFLVRARGRQ